MQDGSNATKIEIAEIAAVFIAEPGAVQLRLLDRDEREWVIRLPLDVLDACLRRVSGDRVLALRVEALGGNTWLSYPMEAWELFRDSASPEPTFACRTSDGCGFEIGFNIDPITAAPTLAVTVAAS